MLLKQCYSCTLSTAVLCLEGQLCLINPTTSSCFHTLLFFILTSLCYAIGKIECSIRKKWQLQSLQHECALCSHVALLFQHDKEMHTIVLLSISVATRLPYIMYGCSIIWFQHKTWTPNEMSYSAWWFKKKSHAAHVLLLRHVHTDSNVTSFIGIDGANTGSSSQTLNIFALPSLLCVLIRAVRVNALITC